MEKTTKDCAYPSTTVRELYNLAPTRYKNSGKKGKKGKRLRGDSEEEKTSHIQSPDSPESSLLCFWLSFPLRNIFQLYNQNKPAEVIERPSYLLEPLHQIIFLVQISCRRKTYRHWIQEMSGPGKIEILRTDLDWPNIWREIAALPANIKETMFLFNQRLLPTTTRCHRFDSLTDENCQLCHQFPETDEHLVIYCPL
ncbi:hypothetical protein OUZ56_021753 [Daphnia magna]|uniref:Reverse transcriptase zinc-binding domain-containing protein n=1 Tax=Daphnia magna TaxID=35525 RepID=A0ABR0AUC1_9CRUS|nr:hypothetical protein OUZ56_021753 [Daphnia magna]